MDAIPTEPIRSAYSIGRRPDRREQRRGDGARRRTVEAAGFRIGADAADRATPASGSSSKSRRRRVWIELDRDCGGAMDELARRSQPRCRATAAIAAIVSAPPS